MLFEVWRWCDFSWRCHILGTWTNKTDENVDWVKVLFLKSRRIIIFEMAKKLGIWFGSFNLENENDLKSGIWGIGFSIVTMHLPTLLYLCVNFYLNTHWLLSLPPYSPDLASCDFPPCCTNSIWCLREGAALFKKNCRMHLLSCKQCTLQNALRSGAVAGLTLWCHK